ncbi:MAG: FAD-dependent monooxygenase [Kofleriaceae bacterium]
MNIACIGGGPAGLYLGILIKRIAPEHDVVIYERNRPADTFGFGVVFSDATLGHLAAADPETHRQITERFARWDDIEIHAGGEVLRSTGHGFCGIERKALLQILQARAMLLGVRIEFEHDIKSHTDVHADVIVACDGVGSGVREALANELAPNVDVRSNKFVWLGSTVPYKAFTFLFKQTEHGLFRVHAYRFHEHGSTFIAECREPTWRAWGLDEADEDRTVSVLERIFADELGGHRLIRNRSIWRNFPTVRCGRWHAGNVVLVGDAAHTAHFSIGSGTKLAMEDAIALRDELVSGKGIPGALAAYEARRRPEVEALQAAAQASLEWFEGTERYMHMAPVQLTYSLMTRSLRVSHASVAKRDPHLARGVEQLLASRAGVHAESATAPTSLPMALGDRTVSNRIALTTSAGLAPDAAQRAALCDAAASGAGLVVTPRLSSSALDGEDVLAAWREIVAAVQAMRARIAIRFATAGVEPDIVAAGVARAAAAQFDLVVLDASGGAIALEQLPAMVHAARSTWRSGGWIAAVVRDRQLARPAVVGHAAQLMRTGASLLWVSSADDHTARLPAAPLADRLRNELGIATCVDGGDAAIADLDGTIAAGRADLVMVEAMPGRRRG